jgi:hypothetical protein
MRAITRIQMMVQCHLVLRFVVKFPDGLIFTRNMPVFVGDGGYGRCGVFSPARDVGPSGGSFVALIICHIIYAGMLFAFHPPEKFCFR